MLFGERNGNLLQYSWLENPMGREAWCATVCGAARVWHGLATKPLPHVLFIYLALCMLFFPSLLLPIGQLKFFFFFLIHSIPSIWSFYFLLVLVAVLRTINILELTKKNYPEQWKDFRIIFLDLSSSSLIFSSALPLL